MFIFFTMFRLSHHKVLFFMSCALLMIDCLLIKTWEKKSDFRVACAWQTVPWLPHTGHLHLNLLFVFCITIPLWQSSCIKGCSRGLPRMLRKGTGVLFPGSCPHAAHTGKRQGVPVLQGSNVPALSTPCCCLWYVIQDHWTKLSRYTKIGEQAVIDVAHALQALMYFIRCWKIQWVSLDFLDSWNICGKKNFSGTFVEKNSMLNHQNGNTMPCLPNLNSTMPDDKLSDMSFPLLMHIKYLQMFLKHF